MRLRLFVVLGAGASMLTAAPAAAQIVAPRDYGPSFPVNHFLPDSSLPAPSIGAELRQARGRIDNAQEAGLLSAREAPMLRREARLIGRLARRYGRDGLSPLERHELSSRAALLRAMAARP